ncbi:MAG TPA: hypothetical protein PLR76_09880 [Hyphomonas sp.]|nr:hypothetical protein [Hyphomonas sp.]
MTPNHEGGVAFGGATLRFDWQAIHTLQQEHGLDGWMDFVSSAVDQSEITALCRLMEIAARVDTEKARLLCFPLIPAREALASAWRAAWTGNTEAPPEGKDQPQTILSALLSMVRFGQESAGASSGH